MPRSFVPRIVTVFCFTTALVFQGWLARADTDEHLPLGDHHNSPVYFEMFKETNFDYECMPSLRENLLKVGNFPEVDISDFDWKSGIKDASWRSGAERLRFLLPFIDSKRKTDRALARKWFKQWYDCHVMGDEPTRADMVSPLVAAYRGMVLVYFLKMEERRTDPDIDLIEKLRLSIYKHQVFLTNVRNFDMDSNHGLIEAIALIEVTRVVPNSKLTKLGIDRVLAIADVSVSPLGAHMEHSPAYHFAFLKWLTEIHEYCGEISSIPSEQLRRVTDYLNRLRYAAYFLQDHRGNLAEIGDSDSVVVGETLPWYRVVKPPHKETTIYDPEAGYAIYKGHPSTGDRRYVVFTIQNQPAKLRYHFHDDALAVYYDYDGEIILGDQGRFEYTYTTARRYFVSPAAHNTIFPKSYLTKRNGRYSYSLAAEVGWEDDDEAVRFNAQILYSNFPVHRDVVVRRGDKALCVLDSIWGPPAELSSTTSAKKDGGGHESARQNMGGQRSQRQELAMTWNIGRDVESIELQKAEGDTSLVLRLKTRKGRRFDLSIDIRGEFEPSSLEIELVQGGDSPMRGWYSPQMLRKRPAWVLMVTFKPTGGMSIATRVEHVGRKPFPGLGPLLRGY